MIKAVVYRCVSGCGNVIVKPIDKEKEFIVEENLLCNNCDAGYQMMKGFIRDGKEQQEV